MKWRRLRRCCNSLPEKRFHSYIIRTYRNCTYTNTDFLYMPRSIESSRICMKYNYIHVYILYIEGALYNRSWTKLHGKPVERKTSVSLIFALRAMCLFTIAVRHCRSILFHVSNVAGNNSWKVLNLTGAQAW